MGMRIIDLKEQKGDTCIPITELDDDNVVLVKERKSNDLFKYECLALIPRHFGHVMGYDSEAELKILLESTFPKSRLAIKVKMTN